MQKHIVGLNIQDMKKNLLIILLSVTFFSVISFAQNTDLLWVKQIGGTLSDDGRCIAFDSNSNVYTTGTFEGVVDFNPGVGTYSFTCLGNYDIYISKLDSLGNFVWAKQIAGIDDERVMKIRVSSSGYIYITGMFRGTTDFDPGIGINNLTSSSDYNAFVLKLDANGELIWVKQFEGVNRSDAGSIAIDISENIYVIGTFAGTTDFDPGIGIYNLTSTDVQDVYITKLNSNGDYIWAKQLGGLGSEWGNEIAVDNIGNVYSIGWFYGVGDYDPGVGVYNLIPVGGADIFVSKLNSSGDFAWAKNYGSSGVEIGSGIAVDALGDVYITGAYEGTIDFDPNGGTYNLTSNGNRDIFISKLTSSGNFVWAKSFGQSQSELVQELTIDNTGNIYIIGSYSGIVDFDPSGGTYNLNSTGGYDIFIAKFDATGSYPWAKSFGGIADDHGRSVKIDNSGNIYMTGVFQDVCDFDAGSGTYNLTSMGDRDIFIMKMKQPRNIILGKVFSDLNGDCGFNLNELGKRNILIKAEPGPYYGLSDSLGNYYIYTYPGTYTVTQVTHDPLWQPTCQVSYQAALPYPTDIFSNANFTSQTLYSCSNLSVDIGVPFLRRCMNSTYTVRYCNIGTITANNAVINIVFPSGVSGQSIFQIGDVDAGECGVFTIPVNVGCSVVNGSTLCAQAIIYPDTFCIPPSYEYDRRQLTILGECLQNDSVQFIIKNVHYQNITHSGHYRIFVNNTFAQEYPYTLGQGDSIIVVFPAYGNTIRLEVNFTDGNGTYIGPQVTLEGCGGAPGVQGQIGQLPNNDADNTATSCMVVTGSFDPNDKSVIPSGVTSMHYIAETDDLDYLIRFQNTGTDTAFTVVIRDTISPFLDIASLVSGASSHNYTFNIYGQGIAEWTFNNILLPDSNVNEPLSHGFVKYKIKQLPGNEPGTVIRNSADIYFDFNEPVITNTTENIIHDTVLLCLNAVPAFNYTQTGASFEFVNNSNYAITYLWDFGDDNTSNQENPSHTFSESGVYSVCLYANNECGTNSLCRIINLVITGIGNINTSVIQITPNPANSEITVSGYNPAYLKLCNTLGQTVAEANKSNKLYVGHLSQGLYLLQLFDANGQSVKTEKVIIAK